MSHRHAIRRIVFHLGLTVVALGFVTGLGAPAGAEDRPRVVKNPYADVNWDQVSAYRANFHSHTVKSDGRAEPDEVIHLYAEAGYHILVLSDHDNFYRHREGERDVMAKYVHRDEHTRVPTSETSWPWTRWIDERPSQIWVYGGMESSAFYPELGPNGMLAVRGAELTTHPHIVSLFNTCGWPYRGQSGQGDEERLACIESHDGLAFWAHPSHYVPGGPIEGYLFDETDWEEPVEYFGRYLVEHDVLLGFEMRDYDDRMQRDLELLDRLLERHYREHDIFVMGSDDNHMRRVDPDAALTLVLAESLTEDAVRDALTRGHMFVGSRTETYPSFNRITVDEDARTIELDLSDYDRVTWVVDGEAHGTGQTLDYAQLRDAIVRFEVEQEEATFYSQAFYIE